MLKQGTLTEGRWTSTIDLLVLISSDQVLFKLKIYYTLFNLTAYLNEEVNRTKSSLASLIMTE